MNRDIDDSLSPFRDRRHTNDNYASSMRNNCRTYRRPSRDYDEEPYTPSAEGYEDYGDIGSNYDLTSEPDYGYDEDYETEPYAPDDEAPEEKAPSRLDLGDTQPTRSTRYSTPLRDGTAPDNLDFSNDEDLSKYLEYIDRYDRSDIDNYDMSRIQRKFANKPFWDTFNQSRDLIHKYGSGNRSTRWPMFEKKNGKWKPIIWRND